MKILICDGLNVEAVDQLTNAGHAVDLRKGITADELLEIIPAYEVAVVRSATKITREVIDRAKNLKLVVRGGVGLDNVDKNAARERHIAVHNTPSATSISVAECTLGLMLALARHITVANNSLKGGAWDRKAYAGTELHGKTLGLIGFGRIGQEVAKRALAFGMRVVACDLVLNKEVADLLDIDVADMETVVQRANYLSLHIPLVPETEQIMNRKRFASMKKGAYLINTARGGLVDEAALAEAVQSGQLAGAAVDVYSLEPPAADNPLVKLPQIITLPHLGGSTDEGQTRAGMEVAQIICEFNK